MVQVNMDNLILPPPSMSTYGMADTTISCMDEEIARRRSELLRLCIARNSLTLTARLPTETLEAIFIHLACDHYNEVRGHHNPTVPGCVNVSYVCRRWRNVALNCPTLWSYLFVTSPHWTEALLSRSKHASLKIHVKTDDWDKIIPEYHFVGQVVNHMDRIKELHLYLQFNRNGSPFFSKISTPARRLQHLSITTRIIPADWEWFTVLFNGDTPALRTLELMFCPVSWYSLDLSGLTALSLHYIPAPFHQNTADLLAILRCMQNLTRLYLENSLASAADFLSTTAFHAFQKFSLPRLSRLWITAPRSTVIALLTCVKIPLKTEVRIECRFEDGSSFDDYFSLSPLLAQRLTTSNDEAPPTVHSLAIQTWWEKVFIDFSAPARYHADFIIPPYIQWGSNIPLQVVINFDELLSTRDDLSNRDRTISDICCSIPLTTIQNLHIIDPPFLLTFWRKVLGPLRDLRYLELSHGSMPDLASVLSVPAASQGRLRYGDQRPLADWVLVPALEELILYHIAFATPPMEMDQVFSADVRSLQDALSGRKGSRGQLTMVRCVVATRGDPLEVDMVGRWKDGHFRVIEESSRPYHDPLEGFNPDLEPEEAWTV